MYDVTVIGAGVVGGLVARTLSKYKLKNLGKSFIIFHVLCKI